MKLSPITILVALLPAILARPIDSITVNLVSTIQDLQFTPPIDESYGHEWAGVLYRVHSTMLFTETDVPQSRHIDGSGWYADLEISILDPRGVREVDIAITEKGGGQSGHSYRYISPIPKGFDDGSAIRMDFKMP